MAKPTIKNPENCVVRATPLTQIESQTIESKTPHLKECFLRNDDLINDGPLKDIPYSGAGIHWETMHYQRSKKADLLASIIDFFMYKIGGVDKWFHLLTSSD